MLFISISTLRLCCRQEMIEVADNGVFHAFHHFPDGFRDGIKYLRLQGLSTSKLVKCLSPSKCNFNSVTLKFTQRNAFDKSSLAK